MIFRMPQFSVKCSCFHEVSVLRVDINTYFCENTNKFCSRVPITYKFALFIWVSFMLTHFREYYGSSMFSNKKCEELRKWAFDRVYVCTYLLFQLKMTMGLNICSRLNDHLIVAQADRKLSHARRNGYVDGWHLPLRIETPPCFLIASKLELLSLQ